MTERKQQGPDMPKAADTGAGPAPEDRLVGDQRPPAKGTLGAEESSPEEEAFDRDELLG